MMRSFVVAVASIIVVAGYGTFDLLSAQTPAAGKQQSIPVEMSGGAPGMMIEMFMNSAKLADVTASGTGDASWVLDASNLAQKRVQILIDVCKDGKIVKVIFVDSDGQPPPKDEDCNRRTGVASFQGDCGVTRITLNFTNFGGRVMGCSAWYSRPQGYLPVIGAVALTPFVFGGSNGPTPIATVPQQPTVTVPTAPAAPPVNTTPPATPSLPAQPTADSFNGQYTGNLTVTENVCRFTSTAGFSARLNVNSSGTGTLEFTYQSSGQQQLYVFTNVRVTMNGGQGTFEAQTDSAQFGYRLIVQGRLSGNAFTGNISFFDSRPGNCHTGYVVNGTRQ